MEGKAKLRGRAAVGQFDGLDVDDMFVDRHVDVDIPFLSHLRIRACIELECTVGRDR